MHRKAEGSAQLVHKGPGLPSVPDRGNWQAGHGSYERRHS